MSQRPWPPAPAVATTPCYCLNGSPYDISRGLPQPVPCHPGQNITHCCFSGDVCLGNGLCLGVGPDGDDRVAPVGCSDASWPPPCPQMANRRGIPRTAVVFVRRVCGSDDGCSGECCVPSPDTRRVSIHGASTSTYESQQPRESKKSMCCSAMLTTLADNSPDGSNLTDYLEGITKWERFKLGFQSAVVMANIWRLLGPLNPF